ncbi:unnamed protein product [Ambrosiozyma monospora]|uniref:Unnamed protein product n=1 Tax=Ambrosiozyma monospora TaxID=43982 RepID=A0A9W6Z2A9_AMBMO|nr:unnamed protein product [Ambrosiozyma monospora]
MLSPSSKHSSISSKDKLSAFNFNTPNQNDNHLRKLSSSRDPNDTSNMQPGMINSPLSLSDESSHQPNLDDDRLSLSSNNYRETRTVSRHSTSKRASSISSATSRHSHHYPKLEREDSLIFERMVQDPMIDSPMPVPTNLPRHFACETFIPASMDMISTDELDNVDALQMSAPRRSSTANLQAAFASSNSSSFGGAPTSPSFSRRFSQSTSNLARSSVRNTSFSNLTSQLQSPISARSPTSTSSSSNPQIVVPMPQVASPTSSQLSPKLKHNKSFYSYADIITEEDQESKYQVRRPSLSLSLSFSHNGNGPSPSRLSRTSSMCSSNNNTNMMSRSINSHSSQQLYQQGSPINTSFSFGSVGSSSGNGNSNWPTLAVALASELMPTSIF